MFPDDLEEAMEADWQAIDEAGTGLATICGVERAGLKVIYEEREGDRHFTLFGEVFGKNRARAKLLFSNQALATYFAEYVLKKSPRDFEDIKVEDCSLVFDLTVDMLERVYDVASGMSDPVDVGLIEKYGGVDTLQIYLWDLFKKGSLEWTIEK